MTSLADSLTSTNLIPPMRGDAIIPESESALAPSPESETKKSGSSVSSITAEGNEAVGEDLKSLDNLKPPPLPEFKESPKYEVSNPEGQNYVAAIGVLGAIGSMFTRRPMVNSMNSASAVLTSMQQGDMNAYERNFEKWKIDNENIKTMSDYQQAIYKDIFDKEKLGLDVKLSMLQAQAAAFKDDVMLEHVKNQDMTSAAQLNLDRQKATHTWEKESQEVQKLTIENAARIEEKKMLDSDYQGGIITREQYIAGLQGIATNKPVTSQPTLSQSAIERAAHQLNMGDKSVLSNMGRQAGGAANVQAIRDRAAELADEEGISPEEIAKRSQRFAGDTSGQRTLANRVAAISAAGAAVGSVPSKDNPGSGAARLAIEASRAVPRGKFMPLNTAILEGKKSVSDPALAQLVVYTNTLVNEYSNATNPTGKGTVSDRTHARELISKAQSQPAYEAAVRAMVKEVDNSLAKAKEAKDDFLDEPEKPPMAGAKKAGDGKWYVPDPNRPGKHLRVNP